MNRLFQFFKFSVIGAGGFFVDVGVYYLLDLFMIDFISRLGSFFSAVVFTYIFNKKITFNHGQKGKSFFGEFWAYFMSMLAGGAINLMTFFIANVFLFPQKAFFSIALGSMAGLFVNFTLSKIVFKRDA